MATYIRNTSTRGRGKRIMSLSSLLVTEFEASLGYKRLCLNKQIPILYKTTKNKQELNKVKETKT